MQVRCGPPVSLNSKPIGCALTGATAKQPKSQNGKLSVRFGRRRSATAGRWQACFSLVFWVAGRSKASNWTTYSLFTCQTAANVKGPALPSSSTRAWIISSPLLIKLKSLPRADPRLCLAVQRTWCTNEIPYCLRRRPMPLS